MHVGVCVCMCVRACICECTCACVIWGIKLIRKVITAVQRSHYCAVVLVHACHRASTRANHFDACNLYAHIPVLYQI